MIKHLRLFVLCSLLGASAGLAESINTNCIIRGSVTSEGSLPEVSREVIFRVYIQNRLLYKEKSITDRQGMFFFAASADLVNDNASVCTISVPHLCKMLEFHSDDLIITMGIDGERCNRLFHYALQGSHFLWDQFGNAVPEFVLLSVLLVVATELCCAARLLLISLIRKRRSVDLSNKPDPAEFPDEIGSVAFLSQTEFKELPEETRSAEPSSPDLFEVQNSSGSEDPSEDEDGGRWHIYGQIKGEQEDKLLQSGRGLKAALLAQFELGKLCECENTALLFD